MSSFTDLTTRIASNAGILDYHLRFNEFKAPSFDENAEPEFPNPKHDAYVEAARVAIIDDTRTLRDLVQGPAQVLRELCWGVSYLFCADYSDFHASGLMFIKNSQLILLCNE
jgi:hypothetical protein